MVALFIPALSIAGTTGYVFGAPNDIGAVAGSVTPFDLGIQNFGKAFPVIAGASGLVIPPTPGEVWVFDGTYCGGLQIYDLTGVNLGCIRLPNTPIAVAFDSTGQTAYALLNGYEVSQVASIDVSSRTVLQTASICQSGRIAISPDGTRIFTNGSCAPHQSGVYVTDAATLTQIGVIPVTVGSLTLSRGFLLVVNSTEALYFDPSSLQLVRAVPLPAGSGLIGVSPNGSELFLNTAGTVNVLDAMSGAVLRSQSFTGSFAPTLNPDATRILNLADTFQVIDARTLTVSKTVQWFGSPAGGAFLDNSTYLLVSTYAAVMHIVDQETATVTAVAPLGEFSQGGTYDQARGLIYAGGMGRPAVVSAARQQLVGALNFTGSFVPSAVDQNSVFGYNSPYTTYSYGFPEVFNLKTQAVIGLPAPVNIAGVDVNYGLMLLAPDHTQVWAPFVLPDYADDHRSNVAPKFNGVVSWGVDSGNVRWAVAVPVSGTLSAIAFSPDSSLGYIGQQGLINVYSTTGYELENTLPYPGTPLAIAVSPDGSVLYGTDGAAVQVLNSSDGTLLHAFSLPGPVNPSLQVSPDDSALWLIDSSGNTLYLMDPTSGEVTSVSLPYPSFYLLVESSPPSR